MIKKLWRRDRNIDHHSNPETEQQRIGKKAELAAETFLISKGLRPICRNFTCKRGEIDLIMQDNDTYVFIEVRQRQNAMFGSAAETVTAQKQQKVRLSAQLFLQQKRLFEKVAMRFDVVAITQGKIDWIEAAF